MSLSPELIKKAIYPPERVIEARPLTVTTSWTNLVNLPDISPHLIRLVELGLDNNPTATIDCRVEGIFAGKAFENEFDVETAPGIDAKIPFIIHADESMKVRFKTASGTESNYKCRAIYEVRPYTVADKMALGLSLDALSSDERRIETKYEIRRKIKAGLLPSPYPEGALHKQVLGSYSGSIASDEEKTIVEVFPSPGEKAILRRIWVRRPSSTAHYLRVYRERKAYFDIYPYCLPSVNPASPTHADLVPIELYIPAVRQLALKYVGGASETVYAIAEVELREMTVWDKIGWGLVKDRSITPDWEAAMIEELSLEEKYKAGIYQMYVQIGVTVGGES